MEKNWEWDGGVNTTHGISPRDLDWFLCNREKKGTLGDKLSIGVMSSYFFQYLLFRQISLTHIGLQLLTTSKLQLHYKVFYYKVGV